MSDERQATTPPRVGARPSTAPPLRSGQAAFNVLNLLDHDKANALRGTDADPFYDDAKLPKFWENLGCAPATIVEEGGAEGAWPASAGRRRAPPIQPEGPWCPVCGDLAFGRRSSFRTELCHGICRDCRAKGIDEGVLAVRRLKRIEAELKAGAIAHDRLEEVQHLAWEIVGLVAAHGGPGEARRHPARGDGDDLDDEVHDYVLVHPGCLRRDIVDYLAGRDGVAFNSADVAESVAELIIEGRLKRGKYENTVELAAEGSWPVASDVPYGWIWPRRLAGDPPTADEFLAWDNKRENWRPVVRGSAIGSSAAYLWTNDAQDPIAVFAFWVPSLGSPHSGEHERLIAPVKGCPCCHEVDS